MSNENENCKCNIRMDVRGRCCPIRSAPTFAKCPARCDTTYFCITNDYEAYKSYCDLPYSQQRERMFELAQQEPYGLGDHDADNVVDLLIDDQKEEGNCCEMCYDPVDEEDRREWIDDDYKDTEILYCVECFDRMESIYPKTYRFRYECLRDVETIWNELVGDLKEMKMFHSADGLRHIAEFQSILDLQILKYKIEDRCEDCHIAVGTLELQEKNYTLKVSI